MVLFVFCFVYDFFYVDVYVCFLLGLDQTRTLPFSRKFFLEETFSIHYYLFIYFIKNIHVCLFSMFLFKFIHIFTLFSLFLQQQTHDVEVLCNPTFSQHHLLKLDRFRLFCNYAINLFLIVLNHKVNLTN